MENLNNNSEMMNLQAKSKAEGYENKYGDHIRMAAESMQEKYGYEWQHQDTVAFGQYADNWQAFIPVFESDTTTRELLGPALSSNMGIITMSYASLPIQNLASVQPIDDEAGTIYFRKGIAETTRGGVTKGDELINSFGKINQDTSSYISESQTNSTLVIGVTVDAALSVTLGKGLKPGQIQIVIGANKIKAFDDGEGHILGVGIDADNSTVNYETGATVIKPLNAAGKGVVQGDVVVINYAQNVVDNGEIPTLKWILTSDIIRAEYDVLHSSYSTLSEMVVRKRFGAELANEITADLVGQINGGVMHKAIKRLRDAAIRNEAVLGSTVTWSATPEAGVAEVHQRQTFDDKLIDATSVMYSIAGRGDVSAIITGKKGKQILKTIGMKIISSGVSGPHICGNYDGVPVYYAPNTVLGDNEVLVVYRGKNWYEAPLVYSPFLPVTTVKGQNGANILTNQAASFHAAGLDTKVDGFVARIVIS